MSCICVRENAGECVCVVSVFRETHPLEDPMQNMRNCIVTSTSIWVIRIVRDFFEGGQMLVMLFHVPLWSLGRLFIKNFWLTRSGA